MGSYSHDDRIPPAGQLTRGVYAARYGIGFLIYGLASLANGGLLGLDSIRFMHDHRIAVSVAFIVFGALLLVFGWRHPE